ncbi:MAG TPA: magnesium transporter [Candidatus Peribacteraceae bacterium]|nr:magnesium transporter [Candidatus Peribacteraceae bacterium]
MKAASPDTTPFASVLRREDVFAGEVASDNVPTLPPEATIGDAEALLIRRGESFDSISYLYILDANRKLVGVLSVHEVFAQKNTEPIAAYMHSATLTAHKDDDAEKAALRALQENIKAVPVIDDGGRFIGEITSDNIMRLLHRALTEDLFQVSGVSEVDAISAHIGNTASMGFFTAMRHRLPWLIVGLLGGLLAAKVVGGFEDVLQSNIILAAYIPLIVYMADAVGTQMEAFLIRDIALQPRLRFSPYFFHQLSVVFGMAVLLSVGLMGAMLVLHGNMSLALTISISLFAAILTSVLTGLCIPYIFGRLRFDPADASGPIATIVQDILSVLVYFEVAHIFLS